MPSHIIVFYCKGLQHGDYVMQIYPNETIVLNGQTLALGMSDSKQYKSTIQL